MSSRSINAREEIVAYVSRYVEQLISDGLLGNVLDALRRFTMETEMELLQNNRALPPGRHHATLVTTIDTTRQVSWWFNINIGMYEVVTHYKVTSSN